VLEHEILVAPALEAGVQIVPERLQRIAAAGVKVAGVLVESVVGRQIHAAAEPPDVDRMGCARNEEANVHVHGRHIGVAWVQHQRDAHRLEPASGQLGPGWRWPWWAACGRNLREADAGSLEQPPFLQDPGQTEAGQGRAGGLVPAVLAERLSVESLQVRHDALLQFEQIVAHAFRIDRLVHGRRCRSTNRGRPGTRPRCCAVS